MAINPNTDFTAGSILEASQQNRFPRGIVAFAQSSTATGNITTETVSITSSSFTAVANRYYKISYFEPILQYVSGTITDVNLKIRITNISGAIQQQTEFFLTNTSGRAGTGYISVTKTLSAGSTVLVGCIQPKGGGIVGTYRDGNTLAQIIVEDLGPA